MPTAAAEGAAADGALRHRRAAQPSARPPAPDQSAAIRLSCPSRGVVPAQPDRSLPASGSNSAAVREASGPPEPPRPSRPPNGLPQRRQRASSWSFRLRKRRLHRPPQPAASTARAASPSQRNRLRGDVRRERRPVRAATSPRAPRPRRAPQPEVPRARFAVAQQPSPLRHIPRPAPGADRRQERRQRPGRRVASCDATRVHVGAASSTTSVPNASEPSCAGRVPSLETTVSRSALRHFADEGLEGWRTCSTRWSRCGASRV